MIKKITLIETIALSMTIIRIKKYFFFVLSRACDKEKLLSPRWESNLRRSDFARRYFTTEPQRLLGERGLLQSSNAALVMTMMTMTIKTDGDSKNVDDSNEKDGESNDHIKTTMMMTITMIRTETVILKIMWTMKML